MLFALHDLDTYMDPDYAWYDKKISFDNGYGASIICKPFSYGGDEKLFEVAVTKFGEVCYDTDVTDDVCRQQNFEDVVEVLHMIHNLPPAEKEKTNKSADKAKQGPKQDKANPYEVPPGPT